MLAPTMLNDGAFAADGVATGSSGPGDIGNADGMPGTIGGRVVVVVMRVVAVAVFGFDPRPGMPANAGLTAAMVVGTGESAPIVATTSTGGVDDGELLPVIGSTAAVAAAGDVGVGVAVAGGASVVGVGVANAAIGG